MPTGTPPNGSDTSAARARSSAASASRNENALQLAGLDGGEAGLELLDRRALAGPERVDERAGVAGPGLRMSWHGAWSPHPRHPTAATRHVWSSLMDARTWLGLEPTHNPNRWVLPVVDGLSTGGGFLFGGCGLGAAIEALEGTTRPARRVGHRAVPLLRPGRLRASTSTSPSRSPATRSPRPAPSATWPTARSSPSTPPSAAATYDADRPVGGRCPTVDAPEDAARAGEPVRRRRPSRS